MCDVKNLVQNEIYPELRLLLAGKFEDWMRSQNLPELPSVRSLAELIEKASDDKVTITHSSLYDWMAGRAKPQAEKADALAKFFAPNSVTKQQSIQQAILKATSKAQGFDDPLELMMSRGPRIGVIPYTHFCQLNNKREPVGFLDGLVKKFLSFASLDTAEHKAEFKELGIEDAERELCDGGGVDMILGLFVNPSRMHRMWFYHQLPIMIPLNAVYGKPATFRMGDPQLLNEMTTLGGSDKLKNRLYPVVDPNELGGIYLTGHLGFQSNQYKSMDYNLDAWTAELVRLAQLPTQVKLPICVTDEVGCVKIFMKAREEIGGRNTDLAKGVDFVRPIDNKGDGHWFPRYRYGLALAKRETRWIEHFSESFEIFLESNVELVAHEYATLRANLLGEFESLKQMNNIDIKHAIDDWLCVSKDRKHRRISETWQAILDHPNLTKRMSRQKKP